MGIRVGDRPPHFSREGTLHHWNRFAAVNDEFAGHHMDDEVGRREGFLAAFIMAPLESAYLHAMLRDWLGEEARILALKIRLRTPLTRGKTLVAGGEVTGVRREENEDIIDLKVWEVDEEGLQLVSGTATVAVAVQ